MRLRTAFKMLKVDAASSPDAKRVLAARARKDDIDLMAEWYIINMPDRLRALGVDFG